MAEQDMIRVSRREAKRLHIIHQALDEQITQAEAARLIDISDRQIRRMIRRIREEGDEGICHRSRGKASNHGIPKRVKERVLKLFREEYHDFNLAHATEKLFEVHGLTINDETLRLWLNEAGIAYKKRKVKKHRQRRERKAYFGELVQIDGSHHDWFEGRGPACCLFVFIDDASNRTFMRFSPAETILEALTALRLYVERFGIPEQIYADRKNIFYHSTTPTDFARAFSVLGGEMIFANSPQGKGRVERANRTHQDRLVKALRERKISTIEHANRFLEQEYLTLHNNRFSHGDGLPDVHRPVGNRTLENIICLETSRSVRYDMTFQYHGTFYQIHRSTRLLPMPRQSVTIRQWLDGTMHVFWREQEIPVSPCDQNPAAAPPPLPHPADTHPWRHKTPIGKAKRKTIPELCHTKPERRRVRQATALSCKEG